MTTPPLNEAVATLLVECKLPFRARLLEQLQHFERLIVEYGSRFNLVGNLDRGFIGRDLILGSLQLLKVGTPTGRLVDVGSGAGLPGIPLAIILEDLEVTLVEPRRKRVAFLELATRQLGLKNVLIAARPVESFQRPSFDWAVARAFKPPSEWLSVAKDLIAVGGSVGVFTSRRRWNEVRIPGELTKVELSVDETSPSRLVVRLQRRPPTCTKTIQL